MVRYLLRIHSEVVADARIVVRMPDLLQEFAPRFEKVLPNLLPVSPEQSNADALQLRVVEAVRQDTFNGAPPPAPRCTG